MLVNVFSIEKGSFENWDINFLSDSSGILFDTYKNYTFEARSQEMAIKELRGNQELLNRLRALIIGDECYISKVNGEYGVLIEILYCTAQSDGGFGNEGEFLSREDVEACLKVELGEIQRAFQEAISVIPPASAIVLGRTASWTFVSASSDLDIAKLHEELNYPH